MNAATSDIQRRESMSMDHVSTITPTPSPHGRPSDYNRDLSSHPNNQRYTNDNQHDNNNHHHLASPESQYNKGPHEVQQQHHYPQKHGPHSSQTTPSPPLPTQDGFQGRPLPPIEPSNSLYTYMNNSRRGSLADPDYYPPGPGGDAHKRPSVSVMDTSNGYNGSSTGGGGGGGGEGRHYATTPPLSSAPELHYPSHPATSPMQLRQSEHGLGRRESLPSIHSSAGPIGQLLAQEPQRRHSIANGDQVGPLKRKTSSTPLSQVHSSIEQEHPSKRRDSIPDAALLHHLANSHHPNHHHPYHPRSSFSAPSSPPRRGSNAHAHGHNQVPVLNLQPAAEIKPSSSSTMIPSSAPSPNLQNGPPPNMMDHGSNRPLFPLHQPRRPSLLSDASLSRRSSLADPHHYPVHFQQQQGHPHTSSSSSSSQDYDHNMNMDMERMHLSSEAVPGSGGAQNSHLYPGYPSDGAPSAKGDTPYSRSPELRVSHKLAERKRRKEMKELFDELRDSLPVDRSLKTSKWEILSKAVDYISSMKANQEEMSNEIDMLRQELARLQKH
ncbi:hypothetical protein BGZ46_007761 [Entomortierella lignicola]|nr:hypothetical protein BGZ46_007761 [Entomortierella lignicola]